ncbi:hypothetical protein [Paracidovorax citrulli]
MTHLTLVTTMPLADADMPREGNAHAAPMQDISYEWLAGDDRELELFDLFDGFDGFDADRAGADVFEEGPVNVAGAGTAGFDDGTVTEVVLVGSIDSGALSWL